jgi:hypothetical protein
MTLVSSSPIISKPFYSCHALVLLNQCTLINLKAIPGIYFDFFDTQAVIEHRKLAVDLAEVIIKWELQRIKDEQEQPTTTEVSHPPAGRGMNSGRTQPTTIEVSHSPAGRGINSGRTKTTSSISTAFGIDLIG